MTTTKGYKEFLVESLELLEDITCSSMMWEYLLYYKGILFGRIYDNRLFIKIGNSNKKYNMLEQIPYKGAKPIYMIENIEDKEVLKEIIINTFKDIPIKNNILIYWFFHFIII